MLPIVRHCYTSRLFSRGLRSQNTQHNDAVSLSQVTFSHPSIISSLTHTHCSAPPVLYLFTKNDSFVWLDFAQVYFYVLTRIA